ncbi:MAG: lipopolysaccharide biosynthesis protein [Gammaproteobacteria bacterium]
MNTQTPEFDEPLEAEKSLADWIRAIKRRKTAVIVTVSILIVVSALLAFLLPAKYQSAGTILIEQQEIPQDFVRSTITTFADQRLQVIEQRVMTSTNLFKIIDKFDLYQDLLEKQPREVVLGEIRDAISLDFISADVIDPRSGRPVQATIAFKVSYEHESPTLAHKVANEVTSLFLDENIKERTQKAQDATKFLEDEADKLESEINKLEENLAEFKTGNVEKLPELVSMNLNLMDRTDQEIKQIDQQLRTLRERQIYLRSELAQINPNQALFSEQGERLLGSGDRLKILKIELAQLAGIYSENHPDILRTKREIAALEKDSGQSGGGIKEINAELQLLNQRLQEAELKYSSNHPDVKSLKRSIQSLEATRASVKPNVSVKPSAGSVSNPAYLQLQSQLDASNSEINSLKITRSSLQTKIQMLEKRLIESPEVERKYRALVRDYDNARVKYADVRAKLSEAKIGESLELGKQSERFTIIEPPLLPEQPVSPNRPAILILGILLSGIAALGVVLLKESMDDAIYERSTVLQLTGYMPIAVLPTMYTIEEVSKTKNAKLFLLGIALITIACVLALLHLFYLPLDVLFYKILRKV